MELLQAGVDCSVIALWLGHESIETTQTYLHAHPACPFQVRRLACTQFGQPASDRAARDTGGRITAMIPPCPADVASAAAKRRRPRSSNTGARASKRWRMADSSITPKRYSLATPEGIPPANERTRRIGRKT